MTVTLECPKKIGGTYKNSDNWNSTFYGYHNKNYLWVIAQRPNQLRIILGYKIEDDFILGSGTLLEINAFKPGQIETFYASPQIGEHPLTKDLNLEGELFLADLSYIAALN